MTTFLCDLCGKTYRTKRGLRDHQRSHRTPEAPALPMPFFNTDQVEPLSLALHALGIDPKQVLDFKVYEDRVVNIEGPVGFKKVWMRGETR